MPLKGDTVFVSNPDHPWYGLQVEVTAHHALLTDPPIPRMTIKHRDGRTTIVTPEDVTEFDDQLVTPTVEEYLDHAVFHDVLDRFAQEVYETALAKGWWDNPPDDGTKIALMHSELSEALEALRHGNPPDDKIPQYTGVEAELADVIIRILDFARARGHDVVGALLAKAEMNKGRTYKHGGKAF